MWAYVCWVGCISLCGDENETHENNISDKIQQIPNLCIGIFIYWIVVLCNRCIRKVLKTKFQIKRRKKNKYQRKKYEWFESKSLFSCNNMVFSCIAIVSFKYFSILHIRIFLIVYWICFGRIQKLQNVKNILRNGYVSN